MIITKHNTPVKAVKQQKGLVLFVALIALVSMSLAAVALIRSVDTNVLVAGNLAFKQSALMSADNSISLASNFIGTTPATTLRGNVPASGYFATARSLDYRNANTWVNSALPNGAGFTPDGVDTSGNTVRYVIERMCRANGVQTEINCMFGSGEGNPDKGICETGECAAPPGTSVIYRVTSRVTGPKNTVSYIQAYVY